MPRLFLNVTTVHQQQYFDFFLLIKKTNNCFQISIRNSSIDISKEAIVSDQNYSISFGIMATVLRLKIPWRNCRSFSANVFLLSVLLLPRQFWRTCRKRKIKGIREEIMGIYLRNILFCIFLESFSNLFYTTYSTMLRSSPGCAGKLC